jgi:hypothetical protein
LTISPPKIARDRERQGGLAAGGRPGYQNRRYIPFFCSWSISIMALVATLVANPSNPVITQALGEAAFTAVDGAGLYWLADGVACDIALKNDVSADSALARIRDVIGDQPVDAAVQFAETRRKKILIADMDSTMIGQECIDELAEEVGLKDKVSGSPRGR